MQIRPLSRLALVPLALALLSCESEQPLPTELAPMAASANEVQATTTGPYWNADGVMNFRTSNGSLGRLVRNQRYATQILAYRYENGAYRHKATLNITRDGNKFIQGRASKGGGWMDYNADGRVTRTSEGALTLLGDDDCIKFASLTPDAMRDCQGQRSALLGSTAALGIASVGVIVATSLPAAYPAEPYAVSAFWGSLLTTVAAFVGWRDCMNNSGGDPCFHDECPMGPTPTGVKSL